MDRLWILAWNSFEEALRRRILYLLVFLGLFVGAYALYDMVYVNMAASAGETEMLQSMKSVRDADSGSWSSSPWCSRSSWARGLSRTSSEAARP